jgi:hypothetical protein
MISLNRNLKTGTGKQRRVGKYDRAELPENMINKRCNVGVVIHN